MDTKHFTTSAITAVITVAAFYALVLLRLISPFTGVFCFIPAVAALAAPAALLVKNVKLKQLLCAGSVAAALISALYYDMQIPLRAGTPEQGGLGEYIICTALLIVLLVSTIKMLAATMK